jgi:hypothetical protein
MPNIVIRTNIFETTVLIAFARTSATITIAKHERTQKHLPAPVHLHNRGNGEFYLEQKSQRLPFKTEVLVLFHERTRLTNGNYTAPLDDRELNGRRRSS